MKNHWFKIIKSDKNHQKLHWFPEYGNAQWMPWSPAESVIVAVRGLGNPNSTEIGLPFPTSWGLPAASNTYAGATRVGVKNLAFEHVSTLWASPVVHEKYHEDL